jgi:hypothetical protein
LILSHFLFLPSFYFFELNGCKIKNPKPIKARQETTIDKNRNCPKRENPNVNVDRLIKPKLFSNNKPRIVKVETSVTNLSGLNICE